MHSSVKYEKGLPRQPEEIDVESAVHAYRVIKFLWVWLFLNVKRIVLLDHFTSRRAGVEPFTGTTFSSA